MPVQSKTFAVAFATVTIAAAQAQGVIMERNISMQLARTIADAALACPTSGGISVAVVDRAGQIKVMLRGDGGSLYGGELARRKAYTARAFRRPSLEWRSAPKPISPASACCPT